MNKEQVIKEIICKMKLLRLIKKRIEEDYQESQNVSCGRDEKSRVLRDLVLLKLSEIKAEVEKDFIKKALTIKGGAK